MKRSAFTKILMLVLCFVLAFSTLVSCNSEDLDALKQEVEDLKNNVNTNNTETDAAVAALQTLVNSIKLTADAAAVKADLDTAIARLTAVETTANAAATAEALAEVSGVLAALEAEDDTLANAILSTRETIEELAEGVATKAKVAELEAAIAAKKDSEELAAELAEIVADIEANAKADAEAKAALEAAIADLDDAVAADIAEIVADLEANAAADAETKAALETAIADLDDAVAAELAEIVADIEANAAADAEAKAALEAAIAGLDTKVAEEIAKVVGDLAANAEADAETKAALEAAIAGLDAKVAEEIAKVAGDLVANAKADAETKAALETAIADLDAKAAEEIAKVAGDLEANAKADAETKTALEAAIADLDAKVAERITKVAEDLEANAKADAETKVALETAIADLDKKVAAQIENIFASLEANGDADAALKEAHEALQATVDGKITAAINKLTADLAANTALDAETKAALEASVGAIDAAIADKADAAALEAAVAEINDTIADLATKQELTEAALACNGLIAALEQKVTGQITKLYEECATLSGLISALDGDVTGLKAELADVKEKLEALSAAEMPDFAADFKAATELLYGDDATYSLNAFEAAVAAFVPKAKYEADAYAAFEAEVARIRFYLNRATSVADIKSLIDGDLKAATTELALHDWSLNFPGALASLKGTLTPTTDIQWAIDVYNVLPVEDQEANAAEYEALIAAKNLLVLAADAAEVLNDAIVAELEEGIVYLENDADVAALRADFDAIEEVYFTNVPAEQLAYYLTGLKASDLVEDYDVLEQMEARIDQLAAAFDAIVAIDPAIAQYNAVRPLFSDAAAINANVEAIDAWIAEYQLDTANITALYTAAGTIGEYELVDKAAAYANAMLAIYDEFVAATVYGGESLADAIATLAAKVVDDTLVLDDEALYDEILDVLMNVLTVKIVAVDEYDVAIDGNYAAMTDGMLDDLAGVGVRLEQLNDAKDAFDQIFADMEGFEVGYDYAPIQDFRDALDAAYTDYNIAKDEENLNYIALAAAAEARWNELHEEYNAGVAHIADIYWEAMELLSAFVEENGDLKALMPLREGNKLIATVAKIEQIILDEMVTAIVLPLPAGEGEGMADANLQTLYDTFTQVAVAFDLQARLAETAAVSLNALFTSLPNAMDLKNYDEIVDAYAELVLWLQTYVDPAFDAAAQDAMAKEIAAIVAIEIFDEDLAVDDYYVFITVESLEAVVDAYNAAVAQYADAEAEANELKDLFATRDEATEWNIHTDDFETILDRFNAYVVTYYAGVMTDVDDDFAVLGAKEPFDTQYAAFLTAVTSAKDQADFIKTLIAGLPTGTIDMSDDTILIDEIETIYGFIDGFWATTGCDSTCEICLADHFGNGELLDLAIVEARANVAYEYYLIYSVVDANKQAELVKAKVLYDGLLNKATSEAAVDLVYEAAINQAEMIRDRVDA